MKEQQMKDKKALRLFLVLTIGVSVILEAVYVILYHVTGYKYMVVMAGLMWASGLSGIIASLVYYRKQNALGIRLGKIRYILLGILIPPVYLAVSYGIAWLVLKDPTIGIGALAESLGYQAETGMPSGVFIAIYLLFGIFRLLLRGCIRRKPCFGMVCPCLLLK